MIGYQYFENVSIIMSTTQYLKDPHSLTAGTQISTAFPDRPPYNYSHFYPAIEVVANIPNIQSAV